jgi:coenzyme F420 hydrogenase subunit beta
MRVKVKDIGNYKAVYLGYSLDKIVRKNAASGGVVTQILLELIKRDVVDKVIVSRLVMKDGKVTALVEAVDDRNSIISAQTSIYFDFDLLNPVIELTKQNLRYAIVMLPCQASAFRQYCQNHNLPRDRFVIIGLFCGHATDRTLLDLYFGKKGIMEEEISSFRFRIGHWRGKTSIVMRDGTEKVYPAMDYNIYQNLFFFTKQRCLSCLDHYAESADISCGDAWLGRLKSSLIKHSILITRNLNSDTFLKECKGTSIELNGTNPIDLLTSQKRSLIFHRYNIAGRKKLAQLFNVTISYDGITKTQWNDIVGAFLILANFKLSKLGVGQKLIMALPKPILYAYALFLKVFINF